MTEREILTLNLLRRKMNIAKIGVLAKGYRDINHVAVVNALANENEGHLYVAIVGYDAVQSENEKLTVSTRIEDAVQWRSIPECAGKILIFVEGDTEKQHSLQELDKITLRDLTIALIHEEKNAQTNVPTMRFWDALIAQSSYHSFESVESFIKTIHANGSVGSAIPASMWCLNLLQDDSILESRCNPEQALIDNRELIATAGQLSAEATKRLSSWLIHAKPSERTELQQKYNQLQNYIIFGDNRFLQCLDYATVKKFLSVSKKAESGNSSGGNGGTGDDPQRSNTARIKDIDGELIEALFTDDEEKIKAVKELVVLAEERMKSEDGYGDGPLTVDGGVFDGKEIECPNNLTPLRKLVGRVCNENAWGSIVKTPEPVLKDAISSVENEFHFINPCVIDDVTSFDARALFDFMGAVDSLGMDGHIPFGPIIEKLIESRNKMLNHIDAIMYIPIWAFGADDELCDELFNYIDLWAELYSAVKNNYPSLKNKSAHGSKAISKAIVLLDTLYVRTPSEWKAILLPLHPLYLWRYYEIFKAAKKATRKKLSQDDILDIKETISRLPQVVNVVIADSLITGGENKILPNSGSIEALPTFENKVNRYVGSDGVLQFSEILERFVGFSPFAQNELRICAVDVPDFLAFLRAIKDFMKKQSGSRKVIIDGYLTRSQNSNNELAKLDFDGKDFEIGEFIKNGRLEISIHGVEGPSKIKEALKKKPVHVAVYFDQSKYTVQYGPSQKNLYVTPLVVTYTYNYDSVTHRATIAPSSDSTSGIIGDYHRILENADIVETDMSAQMTYTETQDIADIVGTIQEGLTQWLVIADRTTEGFEPPMSIPIGEQRTERRMINTWASSESRIITQYISMLCNYNLYPQKETLYNILCRFGHIASNGLISIPKFGADNKAVEYEKKGLLGTLFAAVKYTQDHRGQIPIVASLDTDNARRWLRNSKFGNDRADLIGMRYDEHSDILYVDAIEVKTRENNSDIEPHADSTLGGHAADQIASIVQMLNEIFGMGDDQTEDMFVTARREVLKYQMVTECFRKTHAPASQEVWDRVFKRVFTVHPTITIKIAGLLYHFDLSKNSGGNITAYSYISDPDCKIELHTLSTKEIQKEIFDLESPVAPVSIADREDSEEDATPAVETIDELLHSPPTEEQSDYSLDNDTSEERAATTTPVESNPTTMSQTIASTSSTPVMSENGAPIIRPKRDVAEVRFFLGADLHTQEKFYWEFGNKNLNNRHLLINGNSGCGKTYCIQGLLLESVMNGVSAVVFDYTGGFTSGKLDPVFKSKLKGKITQRIVKVAKIPINPFMKHDMEIDEGIVIPEDNVDVATKIASVFAKIYSLGDQQRSAVYTAVFNGLQKYGDHMSFHFMAKELEDLGTSYSKSVLSKIQAFIDMNPFEANGAMDWLSIRDSGGSVYVIQLSGYDRDVQILLTELLLWDIWNFSVKNGDEDKPFIVVMDEAQNLDHGEKSPSAKILTEGRKFGISGWYATQFMKPQLSDDEIQRLQQAGQKLYFCPPDDGVMTVAKSIDISAQGAKEWAESLKKLKKGECVTCGNMVRNSRWTRYNPRIIKVPEMNERN